MLSVKKEDVTMKKMLAAFMATALIVGSLVGCGSSTKKKPQQQRRLPAKQLQKVQQPSKAEL